MESNLNQYRVADTLNELIRINEDSVLGFRRSAESLQSPTLKTLFYQYIDQRERFKLELQAAVASLDGDPEDSGNITATLHRGWIQVKTAISGNDDKTILAEAERGEDAAVAAYASALKRDLPADAKALVQRQYEDVKEAHDRVRALRDSFKA
jgi:uncharacterized protein (TIGR02284 family)